MATIRQKQFITCVLVQMLGISTALLPGYSIVPMDIDANGNGVGVSSNDLVVVRADTSQRSTV